MLITSCFWLVLLVSVFADQDVSEVKIDQGALKGKILKSQHGRNFASFTGIPFAKPPIGALRFEAPVPADPWEGVLDATRPHPLCPQINTFSKDTSVYGDEDCLYLNVYTPQVSTNAKLPVMFFIHGGAFVLGTGRSDYYGPELLLDKDIVLITANYRLGPLGFFTTGDDVVPGNNGLKDQVLVLKWIKKNIGHFGGDPASITVFGESAGGACAQYHMYSPLSRDLIKNVISQSGSSFCFLSWSPTFVVANRSRKLAELLDCPKTSKEMVDCLKKVPAQDIIKQIRKFLVTDVEPMTLFKPVPEPDKEGAFITGTAMAAIESKKAADVPYMLGITSDDGALRTAGIFDHPDIMKRLNDDFDEMAPVVLAYSELGIKLNISRPIRNFYFGDKPIDETTKDAFTKMFTDAAFTLPAAQTVRLHAEGTTQPIYSYLFDYHGSRSFCPLLGNGTAGQKVVCHGDDLLYLFTNTEEIGEYNQTEADQKMTDVMVTLWTNFAKYGDPTPDMQKVDVVKWEPVDRKNPLKNYYHIKSGTNIEMKHDGFYQDRVEFWNNLLKTNPN